MENKSNMVFEKAKCCPKCKTEAPINQTVCEKCGYQFIIPEAPYVRKSRKDVNIQTGDKANAFLWTFIGFICPILGIIFYFMWRKEFKNRANYCLSGAKTMLIFCAVFLVLFIIVLIYKANGKVV